MDIIVDLSWFAERRGKLGKIRSRSTKFLSTYGVNTTFLLYGDDQVIRHLRILVHTECSDPPHNIVDENVNIWVNLLEVASSVAASKTATSASLGVNCNAFMVYMGQGDENSDACLIETEYKLPSPINYDEVANVMASWHLDFHTHLFYLGRFLNQGLPPDVRWLNGYRVLEWHFRRGGSGLSKDNNYLEFLEKHGGALDPVLRPKQDRKGLIEEVRALVAHAILSRATDRLKDEKSIDIIKDSFQGLEHLVINVMNEATAGTIRFTPNISQ